MRNRFKHTPTDFGTWEWGIGKLHGQYGQVVCHLPDYNRDGTQNSEERAANERLLRAAPLLLHELANLREKLKSVEPPVLPDGIFARIDKAIRTATVGPNG